MSRAWRVGSMVLVAATLAGLTGCATEYSLDLTTDDHGALVDGELISIPVGNAIGVTPLKDDDPIGADVNIELRSSAPRVMGIASTGDPRDYVLWGIAEGSAEVEVVIDGELADIVLVEVVARDASLP